jgi:hypothetical protein
VLGAAGVDGRVRAEEVGLAGFLGIYGKAKEWAAG